MLPSQTSSHYRKVQHLQAVTVASVRRAWRRMEPRARWTDQYVRDVGPKVTALVAASQLAATRQADSYTAEILAATAVVADAAPGVVNPAGFVGVAGDGREVASLLGQSVAVAGSAFNRAFEHAGGAMTAQMPAVFDRDTAARQALEEAERWIEMAAETIIADTVRAATSAAMTSHPEVAGYVRVLHPPSCSRCAVLAGKFYRWNSGFPRHPRCDCEHLPTSYPPPVWNDPRVPTHPGDYFDSLSAAEQDRIFTKAGAQAIRDGADPNQVVNARRGMPMVGESVTQRRLINGEEFVVNVRRRSAQTINVNGHDVLATSEGTTRRGVAYSRLSRGNRGTDRRAPGERYFRTQSVRLMPESIYQIAGDDRDEAIRLLKAHGFIFR